MFLVDVVGLIVDVAGPGSGGKRGGTVNPPGGLPQDVQLLLKSCRHLTAHVSQLSAAAFEVEKNQPNLRHLAKQSDVIDVALLP